jgi:hypothetical protein
MSLRADKRFLSGALNRVSRALPESSNYRRLTRATIRLRYRKGCSVFAAGGGVLRLEAVRPPGV